MEHFNPRSHCRERLYAVSADYTDSAISIHVPIAGNDLLDSIKQDAELFISIHVPIAGNDRLEGTADKTDLLFQSTFPLQGTTGVWNQGKLYQTISIHVPIAGNDPEIRACGLLQEYFNPRSHCRERLFFRCVFISFVNFNPRSHCRERLHRIIAYCYSRIFQSTFPLQGTTWMALAAAVGPVLISIHVPIAGNDWNTRTLIGLEIYFNPRSHCRERQQTYPIFNI